MPETKHHTVHIDSDNRNDFRQTLPAERQAYRLFGWQNKAVRFYLALIMFLYGNANHVLAGTDVVYEQIEHFVREKTPALGGDIRISIGNFDLSRMPDCKAIEVFSPVGTRLLGRTHVGIRCIQPVNWNVLVPINISIYVQFIAASQNLTSGHTLTSNDVVVSNGDLATLPGSTTNDIKQILGKTLRSSISAGQAIRTSQLSAPLVIRQGQMVQVTSRGDGFAVSTEGKALTNAAAGQNVQLRTASGQMLTGIATEDGRVEISLGSR